MTEQEYLQATDVSKIRMMELLLCDLFPDTNRVPRNERTRVARLLELWRLRALVELGHQDFKPELEHCLKTYADDIPV